MFEHFERGAFEIATATEASEACLWRGAAKDEAGKRGGVGQLDDEFLRRMSREIFRDLGLKEAAIAAYFARYDQISRRGAEPA